MDPRLDIIGKRLKNISRIIAISGGKGGIGKSSIASVLALMLANRGRKVGLIDLDLSSPSDHIILGELGLFPKEDRGILPSNIHNIKFMSLAYYSNNRPSPLRGINISNAIIEILAITRWGKLDFLLIDMPPGMGDASLDVLRLIKNVEFLLVSTPSKLSVEIVRKTAELLQEFKIPVLGVIENMSLQGGPLDSAFKSCGVKLLGRIKFDKNFEHSLGKPEKLLKTKFAKDLDKIISIL